MTIPRIAPAGTPVRPVAAGAAFPAALLAAFLACPASTAQDRVIVSRQVGECTLSVEADDTWGTLRLRAHHPQYRGCRIDPQAMVEIMNAAFSKADSPLLEGRYTSLFIGRLIDYPWLSQYLAVTASKDEGWDPGKAEPGAVGINRYVADVLSRPELLARVEPMVAPGGYRLAGAVVEKVLIGSIREVPFYQGDPVPGVIPFDAQVWFRLEKK